MKRIFLPSAFVFAIVAVACAVFSVWVYLDGNNIKESKTSGIYGIRGDYIGGVAGSALSFATVLLVIVGLLVQQNQIAEEKEERVKADEARRAEQFERTFFEMVALHNNIVEAMRARENGVLRGRGCLRRFYAELCRTFEEEGFQDEKEEVERVYNAVFDFWGDLLGHYLRNLYHIFVFVDESDISNKKRFTNIMRAQLSNTEQAILFYNGLTKQGAKFFPLIVRYGLLEQLDTSAFADEGHDKFYPPEAYGNKVGQ